MKTSSSVKPKKAAVKLAVLVSVVSILLAVIILTALFGNYSENIQQYLNDLIPNTTLGALTFVLILTLAVAIGLPRQIAALSAGYLFGISYGILLATLSAILGCTLTLIVARKLFSNVISKHYPEQLIKVSDFFASNTFLKALIIRLIPAGSNFLTNVLAGTAKSPVKPYILGSAIGFIPQMSVFSLMGAGLKINSQQQVIVSVILLAIAMILSGYLYRKRKTKLL